MSEETYDYAVVGAGSAGCVVARRLVEQGADVVLLEAGASDEEDREKIYTPVRFPELFRTEADWEYYTVPQPELSDRELYQPRGKTLGGSSSLNAMIYNRGVPWDYDNWASMGNEGWDSDEMLDVFKRSEDFVGTGDEEFHGRGGPLTVADLSDPHPTSEAFVEAAVECGIERNADINGRTQTGAGLYHVTQRDGERCSSAAAFIKPMLDHEGLTVETRAHVTDIRFDDANRAEGVDYRRGGETHRIDVEEEVVLSAGAYDTPQLLMCSGVGPADHLRDHGIDVVADRPGVGRNLQDHLFSFVVYERTDDEPPAPTSNVGEGAGYTYVDDDQPAPDLQFHFCPTYYMNHGFDNPEGLGFSIGATQVRPESRGRVELASADPTDDHVIDPRYLSAEPDLEVLREGIKRAREIARSSALDSVRGEEVWPGEDVETDAEIEEHVRETAHTVYHPAGTCRMGDGESAVVDDRLRVHGVEGLRIADASVMPTIPSGNTNAPVIAVGERAASLIGA
ncbi:MAG: GMC family oxidoreductase N-terminal domain-containing protein [Halorubrum sp.]|uniref:GMC family oxidoreductase n=1 Tax=Halorubrum sp. TaxID=1879286 RepID=UPI0039711403